MLFQLLNYDEQSVPVKGVRAKVRIPLRTGVRVFYPTDDSAITFDIEGDRVSFPVRPFDIHEAVAIEYQ